MFIIISFLKLGKFSAIIPSNNHYAHFSHPLMYNSILIHFPTGPLGSVPYYFSFLFFRCYNFHCSIFRFTDCSACSNLPLNPSSELLISVFVYFNSRIYFCVLLGFLFIGISILFIHLFFFSFFSHLPLIL